MEDLALFYTHSENNNNTYRVEIGLKEKVSKAALEKAVLVSEKRYPYFCRKVIRDEKGKLALVHNDLPIKVREGNGIVCLGTKEANFHFLSVAYSGETLYFDCYHGLTDGAGLLPFIKTILYYYLTECGHSLSPEGINLADSEIPAEEICDPVPQVPFEGVAPIYRYKSVPHLDLTVEGKRTGDKPTVYRIKIPEAQLMHYISSFDGSPAAFISSLLYKSIAENHPDTDKYIVGGTAVNLRSAYGLSPRNYNNLVTLVYQKYGKNNASMDLGKLTVITRGMVLLSTQPENFLADYNSRRQLREYMAGLPDDKARLAFMNNIMDKYVEDTFSISYVGRSGWGSLSGYISEVYITSAPAKGRGIMVEVNTADNCFTSAFMQSFTGEAYIDAFLRLLGQAGIKYESCPPTDIVVCTVDTFPEQKEEQI